MPDFDREQIERLKEIFVTRKECDGKMVEVDNRISTSDVRLAVIEQQLKTITWLLTTVGAGVITMIIKLFWG